MTTNHNTSWLIAQAWWVAASVAVGVAVAAVLGLPAYLLYVALNVAGVWSTNEELADDHLQLQHSMKWLAMAQLPVGLFGLMFVGGGFTPGELASFNSSDPDVRAEAARAQGAAHARAVM